MSSLAKLCKYQWIYKYQLSNIVTYSDLRARNWIQCSESSYAHKPTIPGGHIVSGSVTTNLDTQTFLFPTWTRMQQRLLDHENQTKYTKHNSTSHRRIIIIMYNKQQRRKTPSGPPPFIFLPYNRWQLQHRKNTNRLNPTTEKRKKQQQHITNILGHAT